MFTTKQLLTLQMLKIAVPPFHRRATFEVFAKVADAVAANMQTNDE